MTRNPPPLLRIAIATPLDEADVEVLRAHDPRIEVVHVPELVAPPGADGRPVAGPRSPEHQRRLEDILDGVDAIFGIPDHSPAALARAIRANPGLRWVQSISAGAGQQVKAAGLTAEELDRVAITTAAGVHADALAEFAVFGVLAGAKQLRILDADRANGIWGPRRALGMVSGSSVLVVGLGSIGRAVAERLTLLGARVTGVHRRDVDAAVERIVPLSDFRRAAASADAIVLCLPGTEATDRILGTDVLSSLRPGTTIVNVGRGSTVDEPALVEALRDGRVGLAVLDVTATEPLPEASPLWTEPHVVLSPHTASLQPGESRRIVELAADNASRLLDGLPLRNRVNPVEFY